MRQKFCMTMLTARRTRPVYILSLALAVGLLFVGCHSVRQSRRAALNDALIGASMRGDAPAVQRLQSDGADPNTKGSRGTPALIAAALNFKHSGAVVDALLARGARSDTADAGGMTALMFALTNDNTDAARSLIAHGADVDAVDNDGSTPLTVAATHGDPDAIKALVGKGTPVDRRNPDGVTALMFAAFFGHRKAVQVLLAEGADARMKDAKGRTAWDHAMKRKHSDIAALLPVSAATHGDK